MAASELVYTETVLGDVRIRTDRKTTITAEDIVETQTKGLLYARRLELRRRRLATGNNSLDGVTYYTGTL